MRRVLRVISLILWVSATSGMCAEGLKDLACEKQRWNVGIRIVDFQLADPKGGKETVTAAVWYPTGQKPQAYTYRDVRRFKSRVVANAVPSGKAGPFPFLLFAHGLYGSGISSAFLCEYLAGRGYVVVGPDFKDLEPPDYSRQIAFSRIREGNTGGPLRILLLVKRFIKDVKDDRARFLKLLETTRLRQASFVIDEMLKLNRDPGSVFHGLVDTRKIGMLGHSMGGATTLGVIGAHPDAKFRASGVRAALILSGPAYPFEKGIRNIRIPVMVMVGDNDEPGIRPDLPRRTIFDSAAPPKYYMVVKNATHFAFCNAVCRGLPLDEAVNEKAQPWVICCYALAFFEKHLKQSAAAEQRLSKKAQSLAYYAREEKAGELFEWGASPPQKRRYVPLRRRGRSSEDYRKPSLR